MFTDIIMVLGGHAAVDYNTLGVLDNPLYLPMAHYVHIIRCRLDYTHVVHIDILCHAYSTLVNDEPIQLQGV